jgi:hypothetical protein
LVTSEDSNSASHSLTTLSFDADATTERRLQR